MCRSIKRLRQGSAPATEEELRAAALQYVRKISGFRMPSRVNAEAFEASVDEIAMASHKLLSSLTIGSGVRDRPQAHPQESLAR